MARYRVIGADKLTGVDVVEIVMAATAGEAAACAGVRGMVISSVEYIESEPAELPRPVHVPRPPATASRRRRRKYKNEGGPLYAVLSFLWPGLGQMCKGQVGAGIAWMLGTLVGYICLILPGVVIHLMCIVDATKPVKY